MFADTLLDFALAIAKPANLTNSSWLQQLALTLFTRWDVALGELSEFFSSKLFSPDLKLPMTSFYSTV